MIPDNYLLNSQDFEKEIKMSLSDDEIETWNDLVSDKRALKLFLEENKEEIFRYAAATPSERSCRKKWNDGSERSVKIKIVASSALSLTSLFLLAWNSEDFHVGESYRKFASHLGFCLLDLQLH